MSKQTEIDRGRLAFGIRLFKEGEDKSSRAEKLEDGLPINTTDVR